MIPQDSHGIGTHPDERRMPEAHHTAIAQDEIKATGHHGVEHDAREETRIEDFTPKGNPGKCYKGQTHHRAAQVHPHVLHLTQLHWHD
jgi:hypothetical protein